LQPLARGVPCSPDKKISFNTKDILQYQRTAMIFSTEKPV
jgi:hypothetical protein